MLRSAEWARQESRDQGLLATGSPDSAQQSVQSSPKSFTNESIDEYGQHKDDASHLETSSVRILECQCHITKLESQAMIRSLCSPKIRFTLYGVYSTPNRIASCIEEYISSSLWAHSMHGDWKLIVLDVKTTIVDNGQHAVVWAAYKSEWPENVGKVTYNGEIVSKMCWRVGKGGRWVLWKVEAIFGSATGYDAFP
jgi:hypothetical protein